MKPVYFNIPMVAMLDENNIFVAMSDWYMSPEQLPQVILESILETDAWKEFVSNLNAGDTWINVQLDGSGMSDPHDSI